MRPFYQTMTNLVQGLFTALALIVLADVVSPTFNIEGIPDWSGTQGIVFVGVALTLSLALGIVIHTVSRAVFHNQKQEWNLTVLSSDAVRDRLLALGSVRSSPGGPTYDELGEDAPDRLNKASAFMHGMEYQVMAQAPEMYDIIQGYRDQYRLARSFVLPCALLALVLPFWGPVGALDGVGGAIVGVPIIRTQALLLGVLASAVCYMAFRERAFRYTVAKTLAWATVEGLSRDTSS